MSSISPYSLELAVVLRHALRSTTEHCIVARWPRLHGDRGLRPLLHNGRSMQLIAMVVVRGMWYEASGRSEVVPWVP